MLLTLTPLPIVGSAPADASDAEVRDLERAAWLAALAGRFAPRRKLRPPSR